MVFLNLLREPTMPIMTIHYQTDAERRDIERAAAYVAELHQLAQGCPPADLLDTCEGLALDKGCALLRDGLASAVQARIDVAEKKGVTPNDSRATTPGGTKGHDPARS